MPTGSSDDRFRRVKSLCTLALVPTLLAAPPQYDHVVIVIEENHSFQDIIGNPNTPYMNWLAENGA